ncbi:MAG TPA: M48 family metalloprotease [Allosphingosinicella sp.]|nr:M48 family metalloprotease [Allosphingosinicella sp.]
MPVRIPSFARRPWPFSLAAIGALLIVLAAVPASSAAASLTRLDRLRAADLRVARVAYRLSVANRGLCRSVLAPQLGFVVHGLEQYDPADRDEVARGFALGANPGVMAVVAGSPADSAGLRAGDQLLFVNGRDLGAGGAAAGAAPTRAFVERAKQILTEEMGRGAAILRISRSGMVQDLRLAAEMGCPALVELVPGEDVNAWADGARIVVSTGLLARCATDDDLAVVIGHELAHNLLRHGRQPFAAAEVAGPFSLLPADGPVGSSEREEEADRLAVGLSSAAGYDLGGAEVFLAGLLKAEVGDEGAATHPEPARRLALLRAAIAEAAGAPVT